MQLARQALLLGLRLFQIRPRRLIEVVALVVRQLPKHLLSLVEHPRELGDELPISERIRLISSHSIPSFASSFRSIAAASIPIECGAAQPGIHTTEGEGGAECHPSLSGRIAPTQLARLSPLSLTTA